MRLLRSKKPSAWAAAKDILREKEPVVPAVHGPDSPGNIHGPAPSEEELVEVETGAAAAAKAAAAGEEAVNLVLNEGGTG